MTIKELIEELIKYNEELEVLLEVKGADDVGVEPRIVLTHRKGGRSCVLLNPRPKRLHPQHVCLGVRPSYRNLPLLVNPSS